MAVSHLSRQPFLYLRSAAGQVQGAGQLADAGDSSVGDIGQAGGTKEREQVVLAHGVERDVAQDHRVGAFLVKNGVNGLLGIDAHSGKEFLVHAGHPLGRFPQALSLGIFSYGD